MQEENQEVARPVRVVAKNRSQAQRHAKLLFGPTARLWVRDGLISVGTESGKKSEILGQGLTFDEALRDAVAGKGGK
jgi:hypothetical protein